MTVVVCDKVFKASGLIATAESTPTLKMVVVVEPPTPDLEAAAAKAKVTLVSFAKMEVSVG